MMLKPYMIFSRSAGSQECASLVFAHSVQEAKVVGWNGLGNDIADGYTDLGARLLRNMPWLNAEADPIKLAADEAHEIDDPKSCSQCEMWGGSPIGEDGLCDECREENNDRLDVQSNDGYARSL